MGKNPPVDPVLPHISKRNFSDVNVAQWLSGFGDNWMAYGAISDWRCGGFLRGNQPQWPPTYPWAAAMRQNLNICTILRVRIAAQDANLPSWSPLAVDWKKVGKNLKDVNVCKNLTRLLTSNFGWGVIYGKKFRYPRAVSSKFHKIFRPFSFPVDYSIRLWVLIVGRKLGEMLGWKPLRNFHLSSSK